MAGSANGQPAFFYNIPLESPSPRIIRCGVSGRSSTPERFAGACRDLYFQFIADFLRDSLSITEVCELYGVSRKTGYRWIEHYLRHGPAGLEERSRRPRRSPNQTVDEIVHAILNARRRHRSWGGKKLLALVQRQHPR